MPKAPQSQAVNKRQGPPLSRLAKLRREGGEPCLPDITCTYLMDVFLEVGPVSSGGFGPSTISQAEIAHWQNNMGVRLTPWECRTLLRLSGAWIEQAQKSEDPACPEPFADLTAAQVRARVDAKIDTIFG